MPSLLDERTEPLLNPRQEAAANVKGVSLNRRRTVTVARGIAGVVTLLVVWELAPRLGLVDSYFLPPFSTVIDKWWEMVRNGDMWTHVSASLTRSLIGFGLAVAVAIPLGAAIAWCTPVREFFQPVLEVFRNTATLALLPVFTMLLGIGETSKIAIVVYACFFPILLSTIAGVATVDPQLLRSARVLGLSPIKIFHKVAFPAAVPTIFTGIRIAGAAAILVLIAAEMVGATAGIGFLINYSQYNFLIPQMYAGIVTTSILGLAINYALLAIERRFSSWRS